MAPDRFTFYLGTFHPTWLEKTAVPLMLSDHAMRVRVALPRARGRWALDSGAYTHIQKHGGWTDHPAVYAGRVRRYQAEVGRLDWAAPQDWPCDDASLKATGLTVRDHVRLSVESFVELKTRAPGVPWVPVLQGRTVADYYHAYQAFADRGVRLHEEPVVGLGSIAPRQTSDEALTLAYWLSDDVGPGKLHAFGVSKPHLALRPSLELGSADSTSWSFRAMHAQREGGCLGGCAFKRCSNCLDFALAWRAELLAGRARRAYVPDLGPDPALLRAA